MNHVAISLRRKDFVYRVRISFAVNSILRAGLKASGKKTTEGLQEVFFAPLEPLGDEAEEEYDDLSKRRKVHYKNKRMVSQDTQSVGLIWKQHKRKDYTSDSQLTALQMVSL